MHCTFSWEGQCLRQRGHRAFSGQQVGISTVGTSSTSTWDSDVSTATRTTELKLSSTVTLPVKEQHEKIIKVKRSFSCKGLSSAHVQNGPCSTIDLNTLFDNMRRHTHKIYLNLPWGMRTGRKWTRLSILPSITMLLFSPVVLLGPRIWCLVQPN